MPGFTNNQWSKINQLLRANPRKYGAPIRRDDSVVIGSFNALKLGKARNTDKNWDFMERIASGCDLIAIQEVMDDLSGIRRLHESLGSSYELIVSDTTGAMPGSRGLKERLAYLYRPSRIELKELVSDITYDRSAVVKSLQADIDTWHTFFQDFDRDNAQRVAQGKRKRSLADVALPEFLTFIRSPHCAAFSIKARGTGTPIDFLGVNAHMLYGKSESERNLEFDALISWLVQRAKASDRMYFKNIILMADLNLEFDDPGHKMSEIIQKLHTLNSNLLSGANAARVNFPFLNVHPDEVQLFRTNARKSQTFDHIALFVNRDQDGLPLDSDNATAGTDLNGYDYGVFDFINLASEAIHSDRFFRLTKSKQNDIYKRAKADISDHMPIWVRVSIPN